MSYDLSFMISKTMLLISFQYHFNVKLKYMINHFSLKNINQLYIFITLTILI